MPKPDLETLRAMVRERISQSGLAEAAAELAHNAELKSGGPSAERPLLASYLFQLIATYASRLKDALALYRPLPGVDLFHASRAHVRLLMAGNQAGKTNAGAVEFARIIRGKDPYQKRAKSHLRCVSLSKDADHIGQVINRKLFLPGAFEIIRDEQTGLWRSVRPNPFDPTEIDPLDLARKQEWYPAPPFVPPGEIRELSYDNKKEQILSLLRLQNETEILFKTSASNLIQGVEIDVGWVDEEIENKLWLPELQARCLRRSGILFWTFTPQAGTQQAYDLDQRRLMGDEDVETFTLSMEENPYLPKIAKERLKRDYAGDPEEYRVRIKGEWAITGRRVYPSFSEATHVINATEIPKDWMRLLALDPGTARPAVLFAAVPPDGQALHVYQELYLRNVDAGATVKAMAEHVLGYNFEVFLIDKRAARQHPMGMQIKVEDAYQQELEKYGLKCRLRGYGFWDSLDDVDARELIVKRMLCTNEFTGQPLLLVHRTCPHTIRQVKNRYYRKDSPDLREKKGEHDLVDCLEYLAGYFSDGLYYRAPAAANTDKKPKPGTLGAWIEKCKRAQQQRQPSGLSGGGAYDWGEDGTDSIYVGLG